MRFLVIALLLAPMLTAAEQSAFGAGDLNQPQPYGLTATEKQILENRTKMRSNTQQVDSLLERVDGLQTIVEGLNLKAEQNRKELKQMSDLLENDDTKQQMQQMTEANAAMAKANEANVLQLKSALDDFSKLLDKINSNYVTKEEYNALVKQINDFKTLVGKELKSSSKSSSTSSSTQSSASLAKSADENYQRQRYTAAIEQYDELIQRNYKPAFAHFRIGEMWYYRKDYGKAISYYKESAALYDQASYMPTLMLHTAFSMKYTGDTANANAFFQAVVAKYPDSKSADIARKELK